MFLLALNQARLGWNSQFDPFNSIVPPAVEPPNLFVPGPTKPSFSHASSNITTTPTNTRTSSRFRRTAHCFYRDYPQPWTRVPQSHFLPHLAEVFASHDRTQLLMVAESHVFCHWQDKADLYQLFQPNITFDCVFDNATRVPSLPLRPKSKPTRGQQLGLQLPYVLIQCPIPRHLRPRIPQRGANQTTMFVSLQPSMRFWNTTTTNNNWTNHEKVSTPRKDNNTQGLVDPALVTLSNGIPSISNIPICSHAWPTVTENHVNVHYPDEDSSFSVGTRGSPPPRLMQPTTKPYYKLSLMTRVNLVYERGSDGQTLSIHPMELVLWLEYHLALNLVDHFYIYDDSPLASNSTVRHVCQPYIQQGLVTYVQYPKRDSACEFGNIRRLYTAQLISTNAALRRYQGETEFLAHWDVDEYLVLPYRQHLPPPIRKPGYSHPLPWFLQNQTGRTNNDNDRNPHQIDELNFRRFTFGRCTVDHSATPTEPQRPVVHGSTATATTTTTAYLEDKQCYHSRNDDVKGLYRTSSTYFFFIHRAWEAMNRTTKLHSHNYDTGLAFLAHVRQGRAVQRLNFSNPYPLFQASLVQELKQRVVQRYQASPHPDLLHRLGILGN